MYKSKKKTIVEYALNSISTPIGVSTYKLRESLPPELRDCLPTAEQLQAELEVAAQEATAQRDETTP